MVYLSQLLNKNVYYQKKLWGKLADITIVENEESAPLSKIIISHNGERFALLPHTLRIEKGGIYIISKNLAFTHLDSHELFLSEDLLDKQVIDIDGKRLVRVNDVALENNGVLKVIGIDIGFSGILRRLGIGSVIKLRSKILPWDIMEAFDYQTGTVRVKITSSKLNTLHPADLADILEEVGTKERLGIVEALDSQKAAEAIEEAEEETQEAILEQLPPSPLRKIVNRMPISDIVDVFYKINPLRSRQILRILGKEKAEEVEKLLTFPANTAGGLMNPTYISVSTKDSVEDALEILKKTTEKPEVIVVITTTDKYYATLLTKDLLIVKKTMTIKQLPLQKISSTPEARFPQVLELFAQYDLRALPIVDKAKKLLGIVEIHTILDKLEEKGEKEDAL